jgi:hypothetical protein
MTDGQDDDDELLRLWPKNHAPVTSPQAKLVAHALQFLDVASAGRLKQSIKRADDPSPHLGRQSS